MLTFNSNPSIPFYFGFIFEGKWYQCGGPAIDGKRRSPLKSPDQVIEPNKTGKVCACGLKWALWGTEGKFKIMEKSSSDEHADVELFEVHFSVPFGMGKNVLDVTATNKTARSRLFRHQFFAGDLDKSRKLPDVGILIHNRI